MSRKFILLMSVVVLAFLVGCAQQAVKSEVAKPGGGPNTAQLDAVWQDEARQMNFHVEKGVDCFTCHTMTDNQPSKKVPQSNCLSCHQQNYEGLTTLTVDLDPNPHASPHYEDMDCTLCHSIHDKSVMMCSECHTFDYFDKLPEDEWIIKQ